LKWLANFDEEEMNYVFYKGQYLDSSQPTISYQNRAFRYGDGFFETIRVINGKPRFLNGHFERVKDSLKAYKMKAPDGFSLESWQAEIQQLLDKNEITEGGRVRVTFSRSSGGFYLPKDNEAEYVIEAFPLDNNLFELNGHGKKVDIFPDIQKQITPLSVFKSVNCEIYIQAALFAREKNIDDALIQNTKNGIIEATTSNLFIVSNGVLYTPGLSDGCIAGTMRMEVINVALDAGVKVYECSLSPQHLLAADEIFLTNAIRGVQWVSSYRTKRYFNDMARKITSLLNDRVTAVA